MKGNWKVKERGGKDLKKKNNIKPGLWQFSNQLQSHPGRATAQHEAHMLSQVRSLPELRQASV